jgi:hypothetical protein
MNNKWNEFSDRGNSVKIEVLRKDNQRTQNHIQELFNQYSRNLESLKKHREQILALETTIEEQKILYDDIIQTLKEQINIIFVSQGAEAPNK